MFGGRFFRDFRPFSEEVRPMGGKPSTPEHNWVEIELLGGVVYDCKDCGVKKEEFERDSSIVCSSAKAA